MRAYRALAALLSYPTPGLVAALPEIRGAVSGADGLLAELAAEPLVRLEERYVALFDRSRALSLHLFEHVHGESRERGQAMVDLQAMYEARGLTTVAHELPDYIPAFFEYLSLLEPDEARALVADAAQVLRALGERLAQCGSRYAEVFAVALALAGEAGLARKARSAPAPEDLDAQWMDPQVTFGTPSVAPVRLYRNGVPA
ncbi:MAG TPA: nitrate reductase molybdenum cofactor assembly chaperone [Burkholderiales bacterium]|nr:nitrate reductase molybdenum cofactor assembly chaperone [Burkholderiales bacterium]